MNAASAVFETRTVDGRHEGTEFRIEAWLREGSEACVHTVHIDGVSIPAGHLPICAGFVAALEAGAHLARAFIDGRNSEEPIAGPAG